MTGRYLRHLAPLIGLGLVGLALAVLHHELRAYHVRDVYASLRAIPSWRLGMAVLFTIGNYVTLTGYDAMAFLYVGQRQPYRRVALASFIGYVFSNNVGLSILGGSAVRYRLLSAWGLSPVDIAQIIAFTIGTFWVGFLTLGGAANLIDPLPVPAAWGLPFTTTRVFGGVLVAVLAVYAVLTLVRRKPIRVLEMELTLPKPAFVPAQMIISAVDLMLSASVLYVLLPPVAELTFGRFVGVYVTAMLLGLVSHVPGGVGVFETVVVLLLGPYLPGNVVLGSLLAYRVIYYLLPFGIGLLMLGGYEVAERRHAFARYQALLERVAPAVIPSIFAVTTFVAGVILLVSGATPPPTGRLSWLNTYLPLPVIEVSHFLGSVFGAVLLLLARGLQRRVDAAYYFTALLLAGGVILSPLKGDGYTEAAALSLMLVTLLPCRPAFYRRTSLLRQPFTTEWLWAIGIAVGVVGWLILWSYRHVDYSNELWWRFELNADAPRSMRAGVGAMTVLLLYGAGRLLRPVSPPGQPPTPAELERARAIVATSRDATATLALLGDKSFVFDAEGTAFIMYAIQGRSWIAMGDPVGPPEAYEAVLWDYRELVDRYGGWPVFYEVRPDTVPLYVELGLAVSKLGETARVPLASFSLEGSVRRGLRQTRNRLGREGVAFEVVPPEDVAPLLDELEAISDAWLAEKHTREKRFSLGRFDRAYLVQTSVALARRNGQVLGFANVWQSGEREELSIDLMRYRPDAPPALMEYLFIELMEWGRDRGFHWFDLGMAPMAGLDGRRLAPMWHRMGALLFRHGEHFYNFQGLRQYKEKFDPVWEPRYLACPGGLALPRVLANVAALVSGGVSGVVAR